ncbi:hypothetical protein A2U01_0070792, partial [Trifolium medium]|nr:hypothetical protein [Trifolium medium]
DIDQTEDWASSMIFVPATMEGEVVVVPAASVPAALVPAVLVV